MRNPFYVLMMCFTLAWHRNRDRSSKIRINLSGKKEVSEEKLKGRQAGKSSAVYISLPPEG